MVGGEVRGVLFPKWPQCDPLEARQCGPRECSMPDAKTPGRHRRNLRIAVTLSFVLGIPVAIEIARSDSGTPANKFGQGQTLRSTTTSDTTTPETVSTPKLPTGVQTVRIEAGPAVAALDHALSKTIDAGNYDMTFSFGPKSDPTATATGSGLANLDPQALSVNVAPRCIGRGTVRIGGEYAWLIIGGTSDPAGPPSSAGRPWPTYGLVQFQGLVGTCFGTEMQALATIEMASPEGMLALSQQAIAVAKPVGIVKVDGEPATEYDVTLNPAGLLQQPGATPAENEVLTAALEEIGSSPMTARVDVDAAGYIVRLEIAVAYPDGFTATHTVTLSNFGDAGTVQLPPVTKQVRRSTIPSSPWPWRPGCGAISCKATSASSPSVGRSRGLRPSA